MKKVLIASLVIAAAVFSLGSVNKVSAQSETPTTIATANFGFGGGHGGMMGGAAGTQQGILHDEMVEVVAEKLGISVDDLNARLANGETMYSIALAEGLTAEEFTTLMVDARSQAIDLAVANGDLTQAQADLMKTRSNLMGTGNGYSSGAAGTRGMGGARGGFGTGICTGTYAQ